LRLGWDYCMRLVAFSMDIKSLPFFFCSQILASPVMFFKDSYLL
jgi:hypothetical protein